MKSKNKNLNENKKINISVTKTAISSVPEKGGRQGIKRSSIEDREDAGRWYLKYELA